MTTRLFLFFSIFLSACNSATTYADKSAASSIKQKDSASSTKTENEKTNNTLFLQHHLKDTTIISGNFVLFLRPDSTRFENYADEDENIYEADSDFGFGISATMDSISKHKKYNNIHTSVSDKRYIVVRDCENCPQTIDRDTINYGVVLTSKGKKFRIQTNLHSGDYLQDVNEYFDLNSRKTVERKQ